MFLDYLLSDDPSERRFYFEVVGVSVVSIVLHELGHALAATWEGDPTPKIRGHLTWDPRVHMGWMSIILLLVAGLGFGRTPVTRSMFRHRRWGEAIVSFAGPAVNLLLAAVSSLAYVASVRAHAPEIAVSFWWVMTHWNVVLFLFNLIPIPPFDGFGVLDGAVDLGEFGRQIRGASLMVGWIVASVLVNYDVIPIFAWSRSVANGLVRFASAAFGGA
jgi:Zn-dependent protease